MYGDSMTAGFPCYEPYAKSLASSLTAAGVSVEIVGCGLCGLTAMEMACSLEAQQLQDNFGRVGPGLQTLLAEQGPFDLVLIMAGTNDLGVPHSAVQDVLSCLQSMHRACWAVGTASIALSIPESSVTGTTQYPVAAAKWRAINDALAAWGQSAQEENPCGSPFFVNTAELVSFDQAACMRGLWDPDNLHFTAAGSREFGSKLATLIASRLKEGQTVPVQRNASGPRSSTPERTTCVAAKRHPARSMDRNGSQQISGRMPVPAFNVPLPLCGHPVMYRQSQKRVAVF